MDVVARSPRFNLRFSLKGAILLMAAVAVGAAAFRDASRPWITVCLSAALVSIFFAIIAAMYGRRDHQAFWTGFAIFAAAYFLFTLRFAKSDIVANLATTKVIDFIADQSHPVLQTIYDGDQSGGVWIDIRLGDELGRGIHLSDELPIIGHCQCTLLLGLLGGLLARGIATCKQRIKDAFSPNSGPAPKGGFDDAA